MHSSDGMREVNSLAKSQAAEKANGIQHRKIEMGRSSPYGLGED